MAIDKPKPPQFTATLRVPLWINKDPNGEQILTVKIFGEYLNFRKNKPKK